MSIETELVPKAARPRPEPVRNQRDGPLCFSHPAEAAFAAVLDFYQMRWEYEPMTFPLEWDEAGNVLTAFSPDFYLVDDDAYVELTTMKQNLVTQKNRKLRLLQELYPEVRCKLMYRRDIMDLGVKYGLFEDGAMPDLCYNGSRADQDDGEEDRDSAWRAV